jgi:hypothetical protein
VFISKIKTLKQRRADMFNERIFPDNWMVCVATVCSVLHQRSAWRLAVIAAGIIFAKGRRTVTSWFRCAGITRRYKAFYYFIGSIGRKTETVATVLFEFMAKLIYKNQSRILMGIDDTPTPRYGPMVEGAGVHRNPTVGPDGAEFVYGHVWVTLSALLRHKHWGTIGLPLLAKMYVRAKDIANVPKHYHIPFKTKLQQAAKLVQWACDCCKRLQKELWIVTDGGYTKAGFLKPAIAARATIVSRLRSDACLYEPLKPVVKRKRGRPRKYGKRIYLRNEVRDKSGWSCVKATLYGKVVSKKVKMFTATYRPAGGRVLALLVRDNVDNWRAFMCSNLSASAGEILEAVADRFALEQNFHDLKEIEGTGQQQVRNFWANIGVFHLNMWVHTMIELWAWNKPATAICDRSDSPWDAIDRRPSHADRLAGLRRQVIAKTFFATSTHSRKIRKIVRLLYKLIKPAA